MPYSSSGGGFAPAIIEPYPAQNQLYASMLQQSPGLAPALFGLLQEQHATGEAQYADQFNQMRQMQMAALHQQMVDNAVKAMDVSSKNPATFDLITHAPGFQSLLGGADPDTINRVGTTLKNQGLLNQYDTIGKAATGMAGGGITPPIGVFSNIVGTNLQPQTPTSTTNTIIGGQYHLAGQQAAAGMMEVPMNIGERDQFGNPIKSQVKMPIFATPEVRQQYIDAARAAIAQSTANQQNIPGAPADPRVSQPQPGTAPGGAPGGATAADNTSGDPNAPGYDNPLLGKLPGAPVIETNLTPKSTGGAQAATLPKQKLADTAPGKVEDQSTEYGIKLQGRAVQGLATLSPDARAEVLWERQHMGNIIPIRRLNGVEYYIDRKGNKLGQVP